MRHLVGFLMFAGVLGGCSMSTVGSMDPEQGGKCDTPMETKQGADGCSECTCDGTTWICEDDACDTACSEGATKTADDGCNSCTCAMGSWDCTTDQECGDMECQPGQTKLGDGGCYRCDCDATFRWSCPDIECMACTPGETSVNDCISCTCNDEGTWSCSGILDGVCGEPMCTPGTTMPAGDGCNTCTCMADSTLSCTMKQCNEPLLCDPGRGDCDGDSSNGCEVDLTNSPDNCGSCGLVCSREGVVPTCRVGRCIIAPNDCAYPFGDCDGDASNGCEVDLRTSPDNCGSCGFVCMAVTGATAVCAAGACSSPGYDTCLYQGVTYAVGESFPARDGCNICQCFSNGMGASVDCTHLDCACDPADEASYRDYMGGPDSCVPLGFMCPEHTTSFENGCGCGCEQSVECPPTYQCPPDESMAETCAELEVRCPYTELSSAPT
jgi:hypothetical protein